MDIETIDALEKVIKDENLLKKHNLEKIGVFGSFARGEKANDIVLDRIKLKAMEEGLPYQTLVAGIVHKYVTGKLTDSQNKIE